MIFNKTLLSGLLVLVSASAVAAPENGVYLSGKVGVGIINLGNQSLSYASDGSSDDFGRQRDSNFAGSLAAGYDFHSQFNAPVRVELEYTGYGKAHSNNSLTYNQAPWGYPDFEGKTENSLEVQLQTVLMKAYWDMRNSTPFTPWVSAGIGVSHLSLDHHTVNTDTQISTGIVDGSVRSGNHSGSTTNFAWTVGAGINWAVTDSVSMDLSYRYVDAGDVETDYTTGKGSRETAKVSVTSNDVMLGVRYAF
ncbi:outer membrane protein [Yersinia wautersii]|uniref:Adhesin/invasin protein PagN n=1 Tax=Yersinia wautersii TaxID=1341643 RepID=A0ABP1ZI85_9GAMM|nr:outer membrane beta-barrel protein [Yersinia wautersii]CRG52589.1 Adhesin/invasin protein PagN [Yersinia wautersii]